MKKRGTGGEQVGESGLQHDIIFLFHVYNFHVYNFFVYIKTQNILEIPLKNSDIFDFSGISGKKNCLLN